jgi:hypothetical protein
MSFEASKKTSCISLSTPTPIYIFNYHHLSSKNIYRSKVGTIDTVLVGPVLVKSKHQVP